MDDYKLSKLHGSETVISERSLEGSFHKRLSFDKTYEGVMLLLEDKRERGPEEPNYTVMTYSLDKAEIKHLINLLIAEL